jgi:hypothetical protein
MALYRILSGVHRCVAAREAGLVEVRALVDRGDGIGSIELVLLSELYSPKPEIGRWDRKRDLSVLIGLMNDPVQREKLAPVELMPISPAMGKYLTPLAQVILNPI